MKKSSFIILMVCLALVGLVSCKNEIEPAQEELIYVSFERGTSRALTATLEEFDVDDYYWSYAAKKNDGSGLKSGQTAWETGESIIGEGSVAVQSGKGLNYDGTDDPVKVPGFSKGYWNFRLFAYTDADRTKLVYWGETDAVLIDSDNHLASVIANPVTTGDGYLKVGNITLLPASTASIPTEYVVYTDEVRKLEGTQWVLVNVQPVDGIYTLPARQYKFSRTYSYEGIPVASGSVIVTVYSNLTTTVSGTLSELTTYAEFGADQNPDIITTSIGTEAINMGTDTETVNFTSSTQTATKVTASMPTEAAQSLITELEKEMGAKPSSATSTTSDLTLNLSVNTTEATETTITYEIGMEATLVYQKLGPSTATTTTTTPVDTLDDFVTIKIELQRGLSDVSVIHDDDKMSECTSYADLQSKTKSSTGAAAGFFYYQDPYDDPTDDPDQGADNEKAMLYIRTYRFSPFKLSYTVSKVVATIGSNQYETLEAAIAASTGDDMIVMVNNVTLTEDVQVGAKELTINLNGYTVTGYNHILPSTENYFTVEETYGDYFDYEYDPGYIRIRHKEASIDSVLYNRLPQAFNAVTDSNPITIVVEHDSVVVVKNTTANPKFTGNAGITIPTGRDITLDLNGFTVTNAVNENKASQVFAVENSTLTIMDSSSDGTGLLTNAVMEGTEPGEWWGTPQYNYATNVIKNSGTVNVVSGKIIQTASGSICYAVDNNSTLYNTVLNISGGYLGGVLTVIRQFCNSTTCENTINMTGGVVEGVRRGIWTQLPGQNPASMKKATVNISGGTVRISSDSSDYAFCDDTDGDGWDNVNYIISGGTFAGPIVSDKEEYTFIIGGLFNSDVSEYVKDGYECVEAEEPGWYEVKSDKCQHEHLAGTFCLDCQRPVPFVSRIDLSQYTEDELEYLLSNVLIFSADDETEEQPGYWDNYDSWVDDPDSFIVNKAELYVFSSFPSNEYDIHSDTQKNYSIDEDGLVYKTEPGEGDYSALEIFNGFSGWNADYYISFSEDLGMDFAYLFGSYSNMLIAIELPALDAEQEVGLLEFAKLTKTYSQLCTEVGDFFCGFYTESEDYKGTILTVTLRMMKPDGWDATDFGQAFNLEADHLDVCQIDYVIR